MAGPSRASGIGSLWRPLSTPLFRHLLLADVVSDVGTFMQSVGAAWLMVSIGASPMYIALTQTATTLPFFLFALPAGSVGDIVNRRTLILWTETWMAIVAVILTVVTFAGHMTPWLLLFLTFALSTGDAFESPTWRAVLPELVHKDDLPAASALNGIEFNVARAVGPALAGLLIAAAGVGVAFLVNVLSFAGVIFVIATWRRPARHRTTPPETLSGATVAALRYVRYAPALRILMGRAGAVMFFTSALFALLPAVAKTVSDSALSYGLLLGAFGGGAIGGALLMQPARARWSTEVVSSAGVALLGLIMAAIGVAPGLGAIALLMLLGGACWIVFISLVSGLVQAQAPDWVRARALAVFMLVTQGAMAAGSALWGSLADRVGVDEAMAIAGFGTVLTTLLAFWARLPDTAADVTPWVLGRTPAFVTTTEEGLAEGPVLVTVEYRVEPAHVKAFVRSMQAYGRMRRRDGAFRWELFRDIAQPDMYLETFEVSSWAEHLRQHERATRADQEVIRHVQGYAHGEPVVRHLVHAAVGRSAPPAADDDVVPSETPHA